MNYKIDLIYPTELDFHVIKELNETEAGPFRMCHASSGIYDACVNQAGWQLCNQIGIINYGEDTGCSSNSPNFSQIFDEISVWYYIAGFIILFETYFYYFMIRMFANPDNVIVINFDDQISNADYQRIPKMGDLVNGWLQTYFGSLIYTPQDFVCFF